MAVVTLGFRWLDILEKEFDKAFVDLEVLVGDVCEYEEGEIVTKAQHRLQSLSSCFAQLTHKAQTIFQNNAKLEAELVHLRREVAETRGQLAVLQQPSEEPHALTELNCLESERTQLLRDDVTEAEAPVLGSELAAFVCSAEVSQLQQENKALRRLTLRLQGELCGARLAAKYLDKELAGRIQQLQLLGRETRWHQQEDKLWRQLEAEINLHRHKTVVRACRANVPAHTHIQTECRTASEGVDLGEELRGELHDDQPRPHPQYHERTVVIRKLLHQNLGMSVTGGREHGVPVVVSVVHPDSPAGDCGSVYVGDAILAVDGHDISGVHHSAAVELLSRPTEAVTLRLLFVPPEGDDAPSSSDDPFCFRYGLFDDDLESVASSSCSVLPRHRLPPPPAVDSLSRASVDSIRGSCDDLLTEDGLARGLTHPGAVPGDVEERCSRGLVSRGALESPAPLDTPGLVSDRHSQAEGGSGGLLVGAGSAVPPALLEAASAERPATSPPATSPPATSPPALPVFHPQRETNSSPITSVYGKHSIGNAGLPPSPPTPVHRKHSLLTSAGPKHSCSRSASVRNCDEEAVAPAAKCGAAARCEVPPGAGAGLVAVPFSRRSSPCAAPSGGSADRNSPPHHAMPPQAMKRNMAAQSGGKVECEASCSPPAPPSSDADTVIFNGSY